MTGQVRAESVSCSPSSPAWSLGIAGHRMCKQLQERERPLAMNRGESAWLESPLSWGHPDGTGTVPLPGSTYHLGPSVFLSSPVFSVWSALGLEAAVLGPRAKH